MIDIEHNPFFQSSQRTAGIPSKSVISVQSLPSVVSSALNIKDEYVPSASPSSGTYKRPSVSIVPLDDETARPCEVTDAMREEMKSGGGYWSAMGLLPVAYPAFYEIVSQVLSEKGIDPAEFNYAWGINPDGIFIFHADKAKADGFAPDFAEEVCMALESALNASFLNVKENPHLFTKGPLPPVYDPAQWGRTIDREEWLQDRYPKFSGFIEELRSDILKMFGDSQIVDFSMRIDDQGKLTIFNVQTEGNNLKANARVVELMNSELTSEIRKKAEYLGLLMLSLRQHTNGDVLVKGTILEPFDDGAIGNIERFKQEVIITSASDYKVVRATRN
jgi:hypothetical protein